MNPNSYLRTAVLTLLLLSGAVGCQDTGPNNETFFVQDETQLVNAALDRQSANGARNDAMLRDQHFDGGRLNSLGRAKLDRMMTNPGPVAIFLPGTTEKTTLDTRRDSILAYAKDHNRGEADVKITDGINPAVVHLAAPHIARLNKTELGQGESQGSANQDASNDLGLGGGNATASPTAPAKAGG